MMTQKDIDRPTQEPNYRFFEGIAFGLFFVACIMTICYLVARWL